MCGFSGWLERNGFHYLNRPDITDAYHFNYKKHDDNKSKIQALNRDEPGRDTLLSGNPSQGRTLDKFRLPSLLAGVE
ncbi:MAG: hypothetical protein LKF81_10965 [Prevotella sp.]|nr:hypothetical protein [Prevotella sp.]